MDRVAYVETGQWPVFIGFTTSEKAYRRELKRFGIKDHVEFLVRERGAAGTHEFVSNGTCTYIITIAPQAKGVSNEMFAALIAHEALHVIQYMRAELNRNDPFCAETESYLLQMIVQHCLQHAWATGRSRKIKP